jgi:V-type H+-transporting ATPase subunit a
LLIGLLWVPTKMAPTIFEVLRLNKPRYVQIQQVNDIKLTPPTYFEINEFVWPFHEIVVTYGTPCYKEINPTTFNMITFPFLFGVMFGDIGHGFLLFLFAVYLCLKKDYLLATYPSLLLLLKTRYLLLLMGVFATYCGFVYNDMMAMPLNLFGSCYEN